MEHEADNLNNAGAAFMAFVEALLSGMKEWILNTGVPHHAVSNLKFTETGFGTQADAIPDYWALIRPHLTEILSMPQVDTCIGALLSTGVLKVPSMSDASGVAIPQPKYDQYKGILLNELISQVVRALRRCKAFPLTQAQIMVTFEHFKGAKTATVMHRRLIAPLINFHSEVPSIELGTIALSEFTPEEKTMAWNSGPFEITTTPYDFSGIGFKLSGVYLQRKPLSSEKNLALADVERFITALRLIRPGDVGASWTWDHQEGFSDASAIQGTELTSYHARRFGPPYRLITEDAAELRCLFEELRSLKSLGRLGSLETGIRRFNQTYGRSLPEDRIIDLAVALENLLLTGIRDELQFRLALRGAALLRGSWQPFRSFSLLQAVYKARSAIVHEGKTLDDSSIQKEIRSKVDPELNPSSFLLEAEQIVRDILREYLRLLGHTDSLDKINEGLDHSIIDALRS